MVQERKPLRQESEAVGHAVLALYYYAGAADVYAETGDQALHGMRVQLFIGLGRGELLPYASYYLTGFLNEKPLARLRQDMAARGLSRAENVFEPEDNIASLMEVMGAMIVGRFVAPTDLPDQ